MSPPPSPLPPPKRLRQILAAARALPRPERDAFVRAQAADDKAMRDQLLALLRAVNGDGPVRLPATAREGLEKDIELPDTVCYPSPLPENGKGDRVHSTATDDLFQKLGAAPELDTNRYHLEGEVGRGGMGMVMRIHDTHLNRRLAMKVMREREAPRDDYEQKLSHQILGRFLEEAQVTSQLDHPGVVPVHELGLDQNGKVYFTMRLVRGRTASTIFELAKAQQEEWTVIRALDVILRVCETMAYAHDKGVLHRDLKPNNVMVGRFGEVYVMDWGLAKVIGHPDRHDLRIRPMSKPSGSQLDTARKRDADVDGTASVVSMDGQALGTPSYMAPEQARSEPLDQRADVYSIGAMLYELLTGCAPYATPGLRKTAYQTLSAVTAGPPSRIEEIERGVPAELVAIVDKAMARDREHRFASTTELAADVRAFLDRRAVKAYRTGAIVELKLWVRRNKPLAAALAAAILILVAGIAGMSGLANRNALLAEEATAAKNDAISQRNRANAEAEQSRQAEARVTQSMSDFKAKVNEFNQLKVSVQYDAVIAAEEDLHPPWPTKIGSMKAWLVQANSVLSMKGTIAIAVRNLEAQAQPLTPQEVEDDRRSHPRFAEFEQLDARVRSLRRAQAIYDGTQKLEEPSLTDEENALEVDGLIWKARQRVQEDRSLYGEEARGLAYARAAISRAQTPREVFDANLVLTLALLINSQYRDAADRLKATGDSWLKLDEAQRPATIRAYTDLKTEVTNYPVAARNLRERLEPELAELKTEVDRRRTFRFQDESQKFLHDQLTTLRSNFGWLEARMASVQQRLSWAEGIRDLPQREHYSLERVNAALKKADGLVASTLYAGTAIRLRPEDVVGLVPIGMNPMTKLWEFYDLRSATDGTGTPQEIAIPEHEPTTGRIAIAEGTGIVFVLLPGGKLTLQTQDDERQHSRERDEVPRMVSLEPFFLSKYELTRGQWQRLTQMKDFPFYFDEKRTRNLGLPALTLTHPAEAIDWTTADLWMRRHGLCLPTEAQWEYGCRAGAPSSWWPGNAPMLMQGVDNVLDQSMQDQYPAWASELVPNNPMAPFADGFACLAPVGSMRPNAFGLHDVHGNVSEWCEDWLSDYGTERQGDGLRPPRALVGRVARGGNFRTGLELARSGYRSNYNPVTNLDALGIRPARALHR